MVNNDVCPDAHSDIYFVKSKKSLAVNQRNSRVIYQVFQKKNAILCGMEKVIELFRENDFQRDSLYGLTDGTPISPYESIMIVSAHVQQMIELETIYLGYLSRMTRIATNVNKAVEAAQGKPVLFFAARFEIPETQFYDGYAAACGGAAGVSTARQADGYNKYNEKFKDNCSPIMPVGTMPHALIAAYEGDTIAAALASAHAHPNEPQWVLVDFENDCCKTAVAVYKAFKEAKLADRLAGVRLDTGEKMIDKIFDRTVLQNDKSYYNGVNVSLVQHVRSELNSVGAKDVQICVSGGFTPDKISDFESKRAPVDVYAVGEWFLSGSNPFTSDIVAQYHGNNLFFCGKTGRNYNPNRRLMSLI